MNFEWDESKNISHLRKHGISFEEATEIFQGQIFTAIDERYDYGEVREISIGAIQNVVIVTVAHTERNGNREPRKIAEGNPKCEILGTRT